MTDVIHLLRDVAARSAAAHRYAAAFDEFADLEQQLHPRPEAEVAHDFAMIAYRAWNNEMANPATQRPPYRYDPHDR